MKTGSMYMENIKVKGIDFNGRRYCGLLVRYVGEWCACVYCGGYESLIVPLDKLEYLS